MPLSAIEITSSANHVAKLNETGRRPEAQQYLLEIQKYQSANTVSVIAKIAGLLFITSGKAPASPSKRIKSHATL